MQNIMSLSRANAPGVYYGEWYAYISFGSSSVLLTFHSLRDDIKSLIEHVPGARHKSFKTLEQATAHYLHAKRSGKVGCVRNPGDVAKFGPDADAIQ
jgi:hypothetical protein